MKLLHWEFDLSTPGSQWRSFLKEISNLKKHVWNGFDGNIFLGKAKVWKVS